VKAFVDSVSSFKMGDPFEEGVFIGPLTREEQLPVLQGQVDDAIAKGANLVLGGKRREGRGYFYEPTVLTNVDHSMQVMQEETFGPVIGIQKVADDAEALQKMNDTRYGLTASVFTRDEEVARGLMGKLQAGTVYWNCCDRVSPFTPWTGWKDSGVGSTLGLEGLRNMVKPKAWHFRKPG
jgi:acyl-CoA reductase-like NAD-dependent aldehyde dehydrogenase